MSSPATPSPAAAASAVPVHSARRRALLRDMGLDHWVLRERLPVVSDAAAPAASAQRPAMQTGANAPGGIIPDQARAQLDQLQAELDGPGGQSRRPAARNPGAAQPQRGNRAPAAQTVDLGSLPATIQCTWLGDKAYIGPHHTPAPVRRFLRDLMVAAADGPGTPSQVPFDTADLAQRVGLEQARLGLQAFVTKRLASIGAQALLLDESLSADLPGLTDDSYQVSAAVRVPVVLVPALPALLDDGAAKRALWLQLLALRLR